MKPARIARRQARQSRRRGRDTAGGETESGPLERSAIKVDAILEVG